MHEVDLPTRRQASALLAIDDVEMASRSNARLLITASAEGGVDTLARRIHAASPRARFPFVPVRARDFPSETRLLRETCSHLLDVAAGGSVLISDVEDMPRSVQDVFVDLLAELEVVRPPTPAVRFIAGTTVSLLDWVAAGTFSDRLFYGLNTIHIVMPDGHV